MRDTTKSTASFLSQSGKKMLYTRQPNGDKAAILLTDKQVKEKQKKGQVLYDSAK